MGVYKEYKGFLIGLVVLFVAIGGLFAFMFCNSFYFYSEFDIDYSDLYCERYSTEDEAKIGHKKAIEYAKNMECKNEK